MSDGPWQLCVVRLRGVDSLRPEKSWRPIITVVVGHHAERQTVLGCDGQNVNMKECFSFPEVDIRSRIEIHVWRKSDSKKKRKKRQLVASTSLTLGELLKKQGGSTQTELRLNCMNLAGKRNAKRQQQKCATVAVRLRAPFSPPTASSSQYSPSTSEDERMSYSMLSDRASETLMSDDSRSHTLDNLDNQTNQLRRRRIRPYEIDSDDTFSEDSIDNEYPSNEYLDESEDPSLRLLDDQNLEHWDDEDEKKDESNSNGNDVLDSFSIAPTFYGSSWCTSEPFGNRSTSKQFFVL